MKNNQVPERSTKLAGSNKMGGFRLVPVLLMIFSVAGASAQETVAEQMRGMQIPLIEITTLNGEEPTYDIVYEEGTSPRTISNPVKVPARMTMTLQNEMLYDSGEYADDELGITIRVRGNSSALVYEKKKPYKLHLQKKMDLFFRENKKYRDKDWVLLMNGGSPANLLGLYVNEQVGLQWTPRCRQVNVILNGEYKGMYMLIESVKQSDGRLNVDEQTGIIAEYDRYYWAEPFWIPGILYPTMNFTFKFVGEALEGTEGSYGAESYLERVLREMQESMLDGTYAGKVDVASFAKWILAKDILGMTDPTGSNIFLTKHDDTDESPFRMANLWDFDNVMRVEDGAFATAHLAAQLFFRYMFTSAPDLQLAYIREWNRLKDNGFVDNIQTFLDSLAQDSALTDINASIRKDPAESWRGRWDTHVLKAKQWFANRLEWLDDTIHRMEILTDVSALPKEEPRSATLYYNLQGIPRSEPYDGLNIIIDHQGRRRKIFRKRP